jgi:L-threonylcarbamoyladenylate synthase
MHSIVDISTAYRLLSRTSPRPSSRTTVNLNTGNAINFKETVAAVVDGGSCSLGIESTVLSLCEEIPMLLRPGKITKEEIEKVIGVTLLSAEKKDMNVPKSPGMKYPHYAPNAKITLFNCPQALKDYQTQSKNKSIIIHPTQKNLYASFRNADQHGFEEILVFCDQTIRKDPALMNRLLKAAAMI